MTDREWLDWVARENYKRLLETAYRLAAKYRVRSPEAWAADMTQSTFLKLSELMKEKNLREHPKIAAWLAVTLYNTVKSDRQKRANWERPMTDVPDWQKRRLACQMAVVEEPFPPGLTEEERMLLYRCHCENIPRKELARELNISPGACQMRLERAEKHFRALQKNQKKRNASTDFDGIRQGDKRTFQEGGASHA